MTNRMPALFVGHGSPMNALEDNAFTRTWSELGARMPRPKAVLCISAHWQTQGAAVTSSPRPPTIHDFRGFPKALSDLQYPAQGHPQFAQQLQSMLAMFRVKLDPERGLDHGVWSVLVKMYPQADVPVVQLSLDFTQKPTFHYNVGRMLAPLRDSGVLIVGTGNIIHNLGLMNPQQADAPTWARHVNEAVKKKIESRDHRALIDYEKLDPDMGLAVPSAEHFLPLLYVLGTQDPNESALFFNDKIVMGAISMTSVNLGG
jgi:4,5-DOPA dioxygenase extradiol